MITDVRCNNCRKKIGEIEYGRVIIKCPKCGCTNDKTVSKIYSVPIESPVATHVSSGIVIR